MKVSVLSILLAVSALAVSCDLLQTDRGGEENGPKEPVFSIDRRSVDVPAAGGNFELTVISDPVEYEITIVDDWISEVSRSGDRTTGETIVFAASANQSGARTGIVSVCTREGTCIPVSVNQAAAGSRAFVRNNIGFRFTATWCGWCPYMDEAFHTVASDQSSRFNYITFHASAGYPLYLVDGVAIANLYSVQGFPTGVLNGWKEIKNYSTVSVTVGNIGNAISDFSEKFPCEAGIGISSTLEGNRLDVKVNVEAVPGEYLLSAFLLESGIVEAQTYFLTTGGSQTLSDFEHDNVARKTISSSYPGDAFTATDEEFVFERTVLLNSAWNKQNLSLAVLVLKPYGTLSANKAMPEYPDNYVVNSLIVPVGTTNSIQYEE